MKGGGKNPKKPDKGKGNKKKSNRGSYPDRIRSDAGAGAGDGRKRQGGFNKDNFPSNKFGVLNPKATFGVMDEKSFREEKERMKYEHKLDAMERRHLMLQRHYRSALNAVANHPELGDNPSSDSSVHTFTEGSGDIPSKLDYLGMDGKYKK